MIVGLALWALLAGIAALVWRRRGAEGLRRGGAFAWSTARGLAFRLPMALLTAAFLSEALPVERLAEVVGPETGLRGIALATVMGGLLPGGPMTSFPIALVIFQGGAGAPQIVAFLTGWSIFAMHRVIAYEAPIMGWGFVALRMMSCAVLPILAGLFTALVIAAWPAITPTLLTP